MAKPIVDGLERNLAGKATVIRLDVLSPLGRRVAAHFGVRGLPTLLVLDGQGKVILTQIGLIRSGQVKNRVDGLIGP